MDAKFKKPLRKDPREPAGLDAFAAGASRPFPALGPPEPSDPSAPESERESLGMNVRFTPREKATLVELARRDARSQHQILKRLIAPLLEAAAASLEASESPVATAGTRPEPRPPRTRDAASEAS